MSCFAQQRKQNEDEQKTNHALESWQESFDELLNGHAPSTERVNIFQT